MYTNTRIMVAGALLALAFGATAHASNPTPPDLCAEPLRGATGDPYVDSQGDYVSRFCNPRISPPLFAQDVCCSIDQVAFCTLPDSKGRCQAGMKFWCEYGAVDDDVVECYQPGPGTCDKGYCNNYQEPSQTFEDSSWVCCNDEDVCTYVGESGDDPPEGAKCPGDLTICNWGSTNEDGTINCGG
ncbi:MAG: hypothetical protein HC927_03155 [Deltaproteobacteria bacterium]|nr:hypothetical protein [Deltaproteobacteria bacterium]